SDAAADPPSRSRHERGRAVQVIHADPSFPRARNRETRSEFATSTPEAISSRSRPFPSDGQTGADCVCLYIEASVHSEFSGRAHGNDSDTIHFIRFSSDSTEPIMHFCTVEEAVDEIRQGRMLILLDDEDRENEGDLIMAAELCTDSDINFISK